MLPTPEAAAKLESAQNLWVGTVRPGGRPHLAPVWFVWHDQKIYLSTDPKSVKIQNLRANPQVAAALEDGSHPVICEGKAIILPKPYPDSLLAAFYKKYEWDVRTDQQYNLVVEITPRKWLSW